MALEGGSRGTKPLPVLGCGDMFRLPRTGALLEVRLAAGNVSAMDCGEDLILSSPSSRPSVGPIWITHSWCATTAPSLSRLLPMLDTYMSRAPDKLGGRCSVCESCRTLDVPRRRQVVDLSCRQDDSTCTTDATANAIVTQYLSLEERWRKQVG